MADFRVLATKRADLRGTTARTACGLQRGQALDLPHHLAHFLRGHPDVSW